MPADPNTDTNRDGYPNTDCNGDSDGYPNTNGDSDRYPNANCDGYNCTDTYSNTDAFRKHIRHCHLLFESEPSSSAKCNDDPYWYFVGFNADRRLGLLPVLIPDPRRELHRDADEDRPDAGLCGHQHRGCGRYPTAFPR